MHNSGLVDIKSQIKMICCFFSGVVGAKKSYIWATLACSWLVAGQHVDIIKCNIDKSLQVAEVYLCAKFGCSTPDSFFFSVGIVLVLALLGISTSLFMEKKETEGN